MDHCPVGLSTMGQICPEYISDTKSRFWQIGNQSLHRAEVICPQPRRATRVPCFVDSLNRFSPKPKGIFPMHRGESGLEIFDIILNKDDSEGDQMGFFCGSPPVRTNNPVVHDVQFSKQTQPLAYSPLGASSPGVAKSSTRAERGSPSCGSALSGSPKIRVEGFSCGNTEPRCVVPALA